jgi:transcriptional regulator with XRE-family HTH domain
MSYKVGSKSRKDRIAVRFLGHVHAVLSRAALQVREKHGVTQAQVARELGVDRSVITRLLAGAGNPTVRTIGELAGALGYRPELVLHEIESRPGANHVSHQARAVARGVVVSSPSAGTSGGKAAAYEYAPRAKTAESMVAR